MPDDQSAGGAAPAFTTSAETAAPTAASTAQDPTTAALTPAVATDPAATDEADTTTGDQGLEAYFGAVNTLLQNAAPSLMTQDVKTARESAYRAKGLLEDARSKYGDENVELLSVLVEMVCLYGPLTNALLMQSEGRYTDAVAQADEAIKLADLLQDHVTELSQNPDYKVALADVDAVLRPFPPFLKGMRANIRAEFAGYSGNMKEYLPLLGQAVEEYAAAETLRPSANPTFLQMVGLCTTQADRLQNRIRNFEPLAQGMRYAVPSGKKILLIHGQNEGKWRELKSLLEGLGREVVVVEEMPDSGAVLIEKCIQYASECAYAIALFTPDDTVKNGKVKAFQARPNVLFEMGWFYGRFGPNRVLILKQAGTEMPSDLAGILSKNFQVKVSEVTTDIQKELQQLDGKNGAA